MITDKKNGTQTNNQFSGNNAFVFSSIRRIDNNGVASYIPTTYLDVSRLPWVRINRLHQIVNKFLGKTVPVGIAEGFKVGDTWTFVWAMNEHEPVTMTQEQIFAFGELV